MPMNSRLLVPQKLPLLLDYAPGAAAAYSLRSLSNSYVGPVVTVRRSTDSAERDFTATEVSDGTLAAWCGGGDGFVKVWHDQSLNGRDATQATTSRQPKICSTGVVVLEGGKPAVRFDGTDQLLTASFPTAESASAFIVAAADQWNPASGYRVALCHAYVGGLYAGVAFLSIAGSSLQDFLAGDTYSFGSGYHATSTPKVIGPIADGSDVRVASVILGPSDALFYVNGVFVGTRKAVAGPILAATGGVSIGGNQSASDNWYGTISEAIYYQSTQTALRTRIEGDLAWYY